MCGCFDNCVGVLVICIHVFIVFMYCFVYEDLFLFVTNVRSENSITVNNNDNNNNNIINTPTSM